MPRKTNHPLLSALSGDEKEQADKAIALGRSFGQLLWMAFHDSEEGVQEAGAEFVRNAIEFVLEKDA